MSFRGTSEGKGHMLEPTILNKRYPHGVTAKFQILLKIFVDIFNRFMETNVYLN